MSKPVAPAESAGLHARLAATGIGYAGLDGAWWLPAAEAFELPAALQARLAAVGDAVFALYDVVAHLLATPACAPPELVELLGWKMPAAMRTFASPAPVLALRPDFQLVARGGALDVAATELEICPSAQGFAHAMQVAAGLPPDLARAFAALLAGRTLWLVASAAWSEFLIEQLAFCRALEAEGARARLICTRTPAQLEADVVSGVRWSPPLFGVEREPPGWQRSLLDRLVRADLLRFWQTEWPRELGAETVLFRFGYLENFSVEERAELARWEAQGATALNPAQAVWENKALLAALGLPAVRAALAGRQPAALPVLDGVIPETLLLTEATLPRLRAEQPDWVLKLAGFDGGERSWGGRSLQVGRSLGTPAWHAALAEALALPCPVVAQRLTPSVEATVAHVGSAETPPGTLTGTTRLRAFLLRPAVGAAAQVAGAHITVAAGGAVAESTASVQAPVRFADGLSRWPEVCDTPPFS